MYFPSVTAEVDNPSSLHTSPNFVRGHETILVAEDDASVRVLVRDELANSVLVCLKPRTGWSLWSQHSRWAVYSYC